ncbi:beta-lactamase hydrolase-family protein [Novosphingobium subterraneum]|uniref:Beta-lactamase hydrolase-family protein n=2 Tax=Novosphingobium subterraneum TaxID=48936 RepID=A0A0B8ZY74_9SPHN|nr:beta-lactamase hydrolase-family protein [Novosphingobium subterraneum]
MLVPAASAVLAPGMSIGQKRGEQIVRTHQMFRKIDEKTYASPQIGLAEVAYAKALGIGMIINNRPEGESDDQTPGADIEAAARDAGIAYVAIPVSHAGFSMPQVEAMQAALAQAGDAPVLAYCRSGTRSTLLWALAQARSGLDPDEIATRAAGAGYDISPIRATVDMLAGQAG